MFILGCALSAVSCSVEGCDRGHYAKGWCSAHYNRAHRGAPVNVPVGTRSTRPRSVCGVESCARHVKARGLCPLHYRRWKVRGDGADLTGPRQQRQRKERQPTSEGYVLVRRPGHPNAQANGDILEHRLIMAEALGRALFPDEQVHHRNGVRHDNRLDNLELRVGAHGAGSDVASMVEWAREILRRYEHADGHVHVGVRVVG